MKQKHLAVALSAIFATVALTGCGSDNDNNYAGTTPPVVTPPVVTPPVVTPPATGNGDNVGDAASGITDLNKTATVGGQQYVRGSDANFDRTNNPLDANSGNATILNSITLQNKNLDNIVLGRETVKRPENDDLALIRYAGKSVSGVSDLPSSATAGLQQYNGTGNFTTQSYVLNAANNSATSGSVAIYKKDGTVLKNAASEDLYVVASNASQVTTTPTSTPLYQADGTIRKNAGGQNLYVSSTLTNNAAVAGNGIDVISNNNKLNGIVSIKKGAGADDNYTVLGQEDLAGTKNGFTVDGSTTSTRIFGNKYRDVNNTAAKNSASFIGASDKDNKVSLTGGLNDASQFKTIKLNNVQYGRVTSVIDKLDPSLLNPGDTQYYQSVITKKDPTGATNKNTVDTYFYRGTGETTVAQMNALGKEGKVSYAGHAVMYGIDNAYHGAIVGPESNSFGGTDKGIEGKGNYVQATVDLAKRDVTGSIFNVWEVKPVDSTTTVFRKDNLVNFKGDINGNTAKGTAQLAYGSKDTGSFKGSFFGDKAQEFGGSVNSVDGSYDKAAWGGVFGTQQVKDVIVDSNANQTE